MIAPAAGEPLYGQDAQFPRIPSSYTTSPDGLTVKDNVTGLMWQKDYEYRMLGTVSWVEIQDKITEINAKHVGGFGDWRLPTIKELYSLWDGSTGWPYIDNAHFPITSRDESDLSHAIFRWLPPPATQSAAEA